MLLKQLITLVVRKYKTPEFKFDENVTSTMIISLIFSRIISRIRSLKLLFQLKIPKNLFIGRGVRFFCIKNIELGQFVTIGEYVFISGLGRNGVVIDNRVSIGDFSRVIVSTSFNNIGDGIIIHNDVAIGEFAYIGGAGGVEIGASCIIGQYFSVHPENHIFSEIDSEIRHQGVERVGITIGSDCWIGAKVTILDGAIIGNGCVVAAGSVVNGTFPNNVVIGGVPARILKPRVTP